MVYGYEPQLGVPVSSPPPVGRNDPIGDCPAKRGNSDRQGGQANNDLHRFCLVLDFGNANLTWCLTLLNGWNDDLRGYPISSVIAAPKSLTEMSSGAVALEIYF